MEYLNLAVVCRLLCFIDNKGMTSSEITYPGITNYGKYFKKNQDAKELKIFQSIFKHDDIEYIKKILKKRIQTYDENLLTINDEVVKILCYASNGNPRFAFYIINEMQNMGILNKSSINVSQVFNCLRSVNEENGKILQL